MSNWARAAALDDIRDGGARSLAYLDKRIAMFRTPGGVFACDNRCPHQGYALVRRDVKEGVLARGQDGAGGGRGVPRAR